MKEWMANKPFVDFQNMGMEYLINNYCLPIYFATCKTNNKMVLLNEICNLLNGIQVNLIL